MEALFIQASVAGKSIIIGAIYKPPNVYLPSFNNAFGNLFAALASERKPCYLLGDFNVNLLKAEAHLETDNFLNLLYMHGFHSLIDKPTRITPETSTLIDNILTNVHPYCIQNASIWITDISDHLPVYCLITGLYNKPKLQPNPLQNFKQKLSFINWDRLSDNLDVNMIFDDFLNKFNHCYNLCFPFKRINGKSRKTDLPWITSAIRKSIKKKVYV